MRRSLATVIVAAALAVFTPGVASAASSWTIQPVPSPPGATKAQLDGVSCVTAASCAAVGYANVSSLQAWSWNGSTWSLQPVPVPAGSKGSSLRAISCESAANCMAVGYYLNSSGVQSALAEQWNGSIWSVLAQPGRVSAVPSELNAVSCPAADACTAVGDFTRRDATVSPLAERWEGPGRGWSGQGVPVPAGTTSATLDGVSCQPATNCIAVGWSVNGTDAESALAEQSGGKKWMIQAAVSPPGAALSAVSCTSAGSCTAVGSASGAALAEHWDGSTWSAQTVPEPAGAISAAPTAISCPTAAGCTMVGQFNRAAGGLQALAERWDGSAWKVQQTAAPAAHKPLAAISCTASRACTAGGYTTSPGSTAQAPLAEQES